MSFSSRFGGFCHKSVGFVRLSPMEKECEKRRVVSWRIGDRVEVTGHHTKPSKRAPQEPTLPTLPHKVPQTSQNSAAYLGVGVDHTDVW